ncbi:unnamed protein product [Rotaria sp. Silwood1]|nr:unnamed protein product [Rotaria sp. Silwood1]CAF0769360.1 unnamed protein product [Rotaria sp. Silwood1]CAF3320961.1 unnamed protein product [Rotaria sp. Silwood1]CAF4612001.1 unnamed protein product [Rotaria sp. Silwood1]
MYMFKEKENQRPEGTLNTPYISKSTAPSGSLPKRYRSVFTEGTPLTSFGVRNDDNQPRSHSPPNHIPPQLHHRPLKPVKEFLTTHPPVDQQIDARRHSNSQTNTYTRSQTEATINNVNVALTKSLNRLRAEPFNTAIRNGHSTPLYAESISSQPMTARIVSHKSTGTVTASNFHYQPTGGIRGSLPTELMTRRPISSFTSNKSSNGSSQSRVSSRTGPLIVQQPTTFIHNEIKPTNNRNIDVSTPSRIPAKSLDTDLHQPDELNFNSETNDEHPEKFRKSKKESNQQPIIRATVRTESPTLRMRSADNQHRSLPEVSVNPHIQSSVPKNNEQISQTHEPIRNGEKSTNHHHIQVEPTGTFKRISSPNQHQQIINVQPNITVLHRRSALQTDSATNIRQTSKDDRFNEAYIERDNIGAQVLTIENTNTNMNDDSRSTLKQYTNEKERHNNSITPPSSPTTQELNNIWRKQRNKYSTTSTRAASGVRQNIKLHRPSCRLKNYGEESDSETTATGIHSKDDGMTHQHGVPPSDLGSDAWSDLTSEFSDTKLRKHPDIRTSTPNITRHSSSISSKEVGQIRKQLTDLQIMYNDLLKLLDIDIESVRSSLKSSTSSQVDHHGRRHRFRKVMPVTSMRQSTLDMMEINQRFTRLESSLVTLAESIAKLSAQIQMQRVIKDDVNQLRQEVAELRQQLNQCIRQQSATHISTNGITLSTPHQPSRLINANVQRAATANSTTPLNISTSYMPSTSTIHRSSSIIDPRQARKIEQFFGTEAMLRYFLSLLNYEQYAPMLEQEKIGIYELPYISERKLQSLGIPYGPCTRMIQEAQQYFISLLTLRSSGIDV